MSDGRHLFKSKDLLCIGIGVLAFGADAVMLNGSVLIWCGLFSALALSGCIAWLYADDLSAQRKSGWNAALTLPLSVLSMILLGEFFIFKKIVFNNVGYSDFYLSVIRPAIDTILLFWFNPESWFAMVLCCGLLVHQTTRAKSAAPPRRSCPEDEMAIAKRDQQQDSASSPTATADKTMALTQSSPQSAA